MAKPKTVTITTGAAKIIAALSTVLVAHLVIRLMDKGVLGSDDLDDLLADARSTSFGDDALDGMWGHIAETLAAQIVTIRAN